MIEIFLGMALCIFAVVFISVGIIHKVKLYNKCTSIDTYILFDYKYKFIDEERYLKKKFLLDLLLGIELFIVGLLLISRWFSSYYGIIYFILITQLSHLQN